MLIKRYFNIMIILATVIMASCAKKEIIPIAREVAPKVEKQTEPSSGLLKTPEETKEVEPLKRDDHSSINATTNASTAEAMSPKTPPEVKSEMAKNEKATKIIQTDSSNPMAPPIFAKEKEENLEKVKSNSKIIQPSNPMDPPIFSN